MISNTMPPTLEDTDNELGDLIKWLANNSHDVKDCREFTIWQMANPYVECPCGSLKKNKFCKHGEITTFGKH